MAVNLHDEIGPLLSLAKIKIEGVNGFTTADAQEIAETSALMTDIISRVRSVFNILMPASLLEKGIIFTITDFINKVNRDTTLHILLESKNIPDLPPARAVHIFRIVQEIIHNTIKHANAGTLKIKIFTEGKKLVVLTADDGTGFDYLKELNRKQGLGLQILNSGRLCWEVLFTFNLLPVREPAVTCAYPFY
jgi:signal transduction histidine kinase